LIAGVRLRQAIVANSNTAESRPARIGGKHGKPRIATLASKTTINNIAAIKRERCSPIIIGNCTVRFPADPA
jgi:hypothetical protein